MDDGAGARLCIVAMPILCPTALAIKHEIGATEGVAFCGVRPGQARLALRGSELHDGITRGPSHRGAALFSHAAFRGQGVG